MVSTVRSGALFDEMHRHYVIDEYLCRDLFNLDQYAKARAALSRDTGAET